jgi:thiol-disulfide isomerase/thioredoxin
MKKLILVFVFFVCWWSLLASAQQQQTRSRRVNDIALRLRGLDGKTYDIADMRGSVVLVSFGATYCQPCSAELRALGDLKKEYRNRPVKFLWVDLEREDEVPDGRLRSYAKAHNVSFPVLRDPTKFTFAQFSDRVRIPMIVFFDKQGHLVAPRHFGMSTAEVYKTRMRERLDSILGASVSSNAAGRRPASSLQP